LAASAVFFIRSAVKVAMPHYLGKKEETKATLRFEFLAIYQSLFSFPKQVRVFYEPLLGLSSNYTHAEPDCAGFEAFCTFIFHFLRVCGAKRLADRGY